MRLLILILFAFSVNAFAAPVCEYKNEFTPKQWNNIRAVFVNAWFSDLSYSVAALSIAESSAGMNMINERSQDYGIMQNNIKTATARLKQWESAGRVFDIDLDNPDEVKELLLSNRRISVNLAIDELKFWKQVRGTNWHEIYASYNGGYYKGKSWEEYSTWRADVVVGIVKNLLTCKNELERGLS